MTTRTVAALYVDPDGPYPRMPDVEWWDQKRDARTYPGPHPVVAHPPCARWCALARLNESLHGHKVGDDGGCFAAALRAVRAFGGVLEHPRASLAWARHDLAYPPRFGWQRRFDGTWVCEVRQSAYAHKARKATWLYYVGGTEPPAPADWRDLPGTHYVGGAPPDSKTIKPALRNKDSIHSPIAFAEYLVALARAARVERGSID
jgi:hypothetical protein